MSINGDFTEFSFAEIIMYLQRSHKTGLLTLAGQINHFFWLNKGCIVATSSRTDGLGLYFLILEFSLIRKRSLQRVIDSAYNHSKPLGIFLKINGFLSFDVLRILFDFQVLRELYAIENEAGICFSFDKDATIPNMELTGLTLPLNYLLCPNHYWTDYTRHYIKTAK